MNHIQHFYCTFIISIIFYSNAGKYMWFVVIYDKSVTTNNEEIYEV
jgi:hypothetical protein